MRRRARHGRAARVATGVLSAATVLAIAGRAIADPQTTVGLTLGAAGRGVDRRIWDETVFHLGLHADLLFGRDAGDELALGPYAQLGIHAFDELRFGGGISALLPVTETFPLVLSAGGYGRAAPEPYGLEPGLSGRLFWGSRSYNHHSMYGLAGGVAAEMQYGLGASREVALAITAQLDVVLLTLPFQLLVNALRPTPGTGAPE